MFGKFVLLYVLIVCVTANENEDMSQMLRRLENLEVQVKEQKSVILDQSNRLKDQDLKIEKLQALAEAQQATITQRSEERCSTLTEIKSPRRAKNTPPRKSRFMMDAYETVAFHATIQNTQDHIDINQTIVFDSVKLNVGGSYHASGGIFIAPVNGIYVFSTSVTFNNNLDESHVIIEKNGVEIAGAYGNARNGLHEQGSVTVATQLKTGDEVYVSNQRHHDVIVYGDNLSSFMGFLLYIV